LPVPRPSRDRPSELRDSPESPLAPVSSPEVSDRTDSGIKTVSRYFAAVAAAGSSEKGSDFGTDRERRDVSVARAKRLLRSPGRVFGTHTWSLGFLPYASPSDATVFLMDDDTLVEGNLATALLAFDDDVERRKTRVVADQLEALGLRTTIVERRFDTSFRPSDREPTIALAGFDSPEPRRWLGGGRFDRVVDAGLGDGTVDYLDMVRHTFPSTLDPENTFVQRQRAERAIPDAYRDEIERMIREGADEGDVTCGMTEVAGISVAAAFVGATAGALVVADLLRWLHGGADYTVISLDLRDLGDVAAVLNADPGPFSNPGFTAARPA
jgi:hypothetical protein